MPTVRCSFVHAHRALLFFDPLRLVTRCIESALQAGLSRLAVADEHEPELVNGNFVAGAQVLQHCKPSSSHNFVGRSREASAFPSVVANAGGGIVVQGHNGKLGFVEEGGDEAAHAGNVYVVNCRCMRQMRKSARTKVEQRMMKALKLNKVMRGSRGK